MSYTYTPAYKQSINNEAASAVLPIGPPPGSVMSYLGTTDPPGWVIANGVPRTIGTPNWYSNLLQMNIGNNSTTAPFSYRYIRIVITKRFGAGFDSLTLGRLIFFKNKDSINKASSTDNANIHTGFTVLTDANSNGAYGGYIDFSIVNAFDTADYKASSTSVPTVSGATTKTAFAIGSTTVIDNLNIIVTIDLGSSQNIYGYALFSGRDITTTSGAPNDANPKGWTLWGSNSISTTEKRNNVTGWNFMDEVELVQAPTAANQLMLCRHSVSGYVSAVTNKPDLTLYPNRFASTTYTPPNYNGAFLRGAGTSPHSKHVGLSVRTPQRDGVERHSHYVNFNYYSSTIVDGATNAMVNIGGSGTSRILYDGLLDNNEDGAILGYETRPYNFSVNWIIKL